MAVWDTVAGGVVGGLTGALTAYVTAQGKVKAVRAESEGKVTAVRAEFEGKVTAVRAEFEGKYGQIELERSHELADRQAATAASVHADAKERAEALRLAATKLVDALKRPDSMRHNVSEARDLVTGATAAIREAGELGDLAQRLSDASGRDDTDEAALVLRRLRELT
jgi:hypothetical protein